MTKPPSDDAKAKADATLRAARGLASEAIGKLLGDDAAIRQGRADQRADREPAKPAKDTP